MKRLFPIVLVSAFCCGSALPQSVSTFNDVPIGAAGRVKWFTENTVGPASLAGGLFSSGFGTALNLPKEYGTHWDGFGKRYGLRLTGVATGNFIEAGLGAVWDEDPRYFRAAGQPVGSRIGHAIKMTFATRDREGALIPAYARYVG